MHFCGEKHQLVIRVQISDIWRTMFFLLILALTSCMQAALGTLAKLPAKWLRDGRWMAETVLRTEIDRN